MQTKPATRWTEDEQQRVDQYRAAYATLTDAIVEYAAEYLIHRGKMIAACSRRELSPSAIVALEAEGAAFATSLRDGLDAVPLLSIWKYMRSHGYANDEGLPEQIGPLSKIADRHLQPLSATDGIALHPSGGTGWGRLFHNVLSAETWPGLVRKRVCRPTAIAHHGMQEYFPGAPLRELAWADVQHPIHKSFRSVAAAAQRLDTIDLKKGNV